MSKSNAKKSGSTVREITKAQERKLKYDSYWKALIMFMTVGMCRYGWSEEEMTDFIEILNRYDKAANKDHDISMTKITRIVEEERNMKFKW